MSVNAKQERQVLIPPTTPTQYITGIPALNLPAPEGTTGDWHFISTFYAVNKSGKKLDLQLAGDGQVLDTNHIYGSYGIYECGSAMRERGLQIPLEMTAVYAANHNRAILDMVYRSLLVHHKVLGLVGAAEAWLDTQEQKLFLLEKAAEMLSFVGEREREALRCWIDKEREPGYRS